MKTTLKLVICFISAISIMVITSCTKDIDTIMTEETEGLSTITLVKLSAIDGFSGPCAKKFDFEGEIKADGPMTVTYTWLRSDGTTAPETTMEFVEAGTKTVTTSWTLGESGNSYEGYWQQLKVISPQEVLSERAVFTLNCEEEPLVITATASVIGDDDFMGECPKRFDFEGTITTNGPATVTYTWLGSDGATGTANTFDFTEAGTQTVNFSWTLGGSGNKYEGYWRQLQVITPYEVVSERATFDLDCDGPTIIDFSTFGGATRILSESALASDGIARIRTVIGSSYCDDAEPALRAAGELDAPFSYLSTARPTAFNSCNGMPLEFTFTEPVRRVVIEFHGAAVDYLLTAYNESGAELSNATETAIPYDYSTPSTVTLDEGSATIARVTFGYTTANTNIRRIIFEH